jgi:phosphatidylglycerol:prolipoprotein diacylglycerol transferase
MIYFFTFDLSPTLVHLGPLQIRYYGIIFALTIYLGYLLWRHQMTRGGYPADLADRFLIWGVVAVVAGARLGHCLFYEPEYYLKNPLQILYVWKGGLASHGATAGLLITLILFSLKHKLKIMDILDRFSMSAALGSAMIRLGNFFNSEIVGRPTDLPWGVRFIRYDGGRVPRHPSQIYEFLMGLSVLLVLYIVDRKAGKENRPTGLMAGVFLTLYFSFRFLVEFVKEYQVENPSFLTMGQYLSIPFIALGIGVLVWSRHNAKKKNESKAS